MVDSNSPLSASLLRRLAEAADGYRDGMRRKVVARRGPPHNVVGVFLEEDDRGINEALAAAGPEFEAFGPFLTPRIEEFANRAHDVVSVTVTFTGQEPQVFPADKYDALIWSIPAFDKLVVPYLTHVSGIEYVARARAEFIAGSAIGHSLYSF